jgi:hypothetical protein
MAVQSRSVLGPDAPQLGGDKALATSASSRRPAITGTRRLRDDDKPVQDATRQRFVGLLVAPGVVPPA